jgi:hypothetical protein
MQYMYCNNINMTLYAIIAGVDCVTVSLFSFPSSAGESMLDVLSASRWRFACAESGRRGQTERMEQ